MALATCVADGNVTDLPTVGKGTGIVISQLVLEGMSDDLEEISDTGSRSHQVYWAAGLSSHNK